MSVLKAAEIVLSEAGTPLHYREITKRSLERGLWKTSGKTPQDTMSAALSVDVLRKGDTSLFQRTDKGIFALRSWGLTEYKGGSSKIKPTSPATTVSGDDTAAKTLSFTDAAQKVLEEFGGKKPIHYRTITEKALELGLVHTAGKTPEATLYAQILTEIKRQEQRGEGPRFIKFGKGLVGLAKWMGHGLGDQIQQHNDRIRRQLHANLFAMPPADFEALIGKLLGKIGFVEVSVTGHSSDGGVDVRGTMVVGEVIRTRMAVQVKRWKNNVQSPVVQQVRGSLGAHEKGLIITTSGFSKGASEEATAPNKVPIDLMNGQQLVELLVENDIGVRRTSYHLIELGEDVDEDE